MPQPEIHDAQAAHFVGTIWSAVEAAGGPEIPPFGHHYFPGAFDESWINANPLPLENSQIVTLASPQGFLRLSPDQVAKHYEEQPRTKIYRGFDTAGWLATGRQFLMWLAEYEVVFAAYESSATDERLRPHGDDRPVVVTQWSGKKAWWLGEQASQKGEEPAVVLRPGDVLVVPKHYPHDVHAVAGGLSLHLATGIDLDKRITKDQFVINQAD